MTTDAGRYVFSELVPSYEKEEPVHEDIPECFQYYLAVAMREFEKLKNFLDLNDNQR